MEKKVKVYREGDFLKLEISLKVGDSTLEVKKDFEEKTELENLKVPVICCTNDPNHISVEDHGAKGYLITTSKGVYDISVIEE